MHIVEDAKEWLANPKDLEKNFIKVLHKLYNAGAVDIQTVRYIEGVPYAIYIKLPEDINKLKLVMLEAIRSKPYTSELCEDNTLYLWWG